MNLSRLYQADETGWLEEMAKLAKEGQRDRIDYKHLSEYLADMARRARREVVSRLVVYLTHRLKWDFQPRLRSRSWKLTLLHQQQQLNSALDGKTLRNHALESLPKAYKQAVALAAVETDMEEYDFPAECPYSLESILTDPFDQDAYNHD